MGWATLRIATAASLQMAVVVAFQMAITAAFQSFAIIECHRSSIAGTFHMAATCLHQIIGNRMVIAVKRGPIAYHTLMGFVERTYFVVIDS
jgi:hypothetical protein